MIRHQLTSLQQPKQNKWTFFLLTPNFSILLDQDLDLVMPKLAYVIPRRSRILWSPEGHGIGRRRSVLERRLQLLNLRYKDSFSRLEFSAFKLAFHSISGLLGLVELAEDAPNVFALKKSVIKAAEVVS